MTLTRTARLTSSTRLTPIPAPSTQRTHPTALTTACGRFTCGMSIGSTDRPSAPSAQTSVRARAAPTAGRRWMRHRRRPQWAARAWRQTAPSIRWGPRASSWSRRTLTRRAAARTSSTGVSTASSSSPRSTRTSSFGSSMRAARMASSGTRRHASQRIHGATSTTPSGCRSRPRRRARSAMRAARRTPTRTALPIWTTSPSSISMMSRAAPETQPLTIRGRSTQAAASRRGGSGGSVRARPRARRRA
mmetsp:Transcript_36232/g.62724  ORF Transcript_36232/g.62724 Transcript_36232/m.62724 type:complete len:247 (-) Transcript_36232:2087-2827(-)